MLFTFQTAVFTLLTLASLLDAVSSTAFPFSIPSSSFELVGPPGLNYTSFDELSGLNFDWDMVDANGNDVSFAWTEVSDATVELMSGPSAQALNSSVMEPLYMAGSDETNINLPANLPNGVYHIHLTSVVNTTVGSQTTIQTLTASGADIHWTRPNSDVGCGPGLQPNAFTPIKDVNDPRFTSFVLTSPYAGQNYPLVNYSTIFVEWGWRISANRGADGITSAELQVLNATSGKPVLESAIALDYVTLEGFLSCWLNPVHLGLQENTQYRLQLKYINTVQDGPIPPGMIVTHTGDVFNVVPTGVDCDARNLLLDSAPVSSSSIRSSSAAPSSSSRPMASSSTSTVSSSASSVARSSSIAVSSRPGASSAPGNTPSVSSNPVSIFSNHPSSTPALSRLSPSSTPISASSLSHTPSVLPTPPASSTGVSNPKSSASPSNTSPANNASPSSDGTGNAPSNNGSGDSASGADSGSTSSGSGTGNASSDPGSGSASPHSGSPGSGNDSSNPVSGSGLSSKTDSGKSASNTGSAFPKQPGGGHGQGEPKQCKKKHGHKYKHQKSPHRQSESYGDHSDSF
ncbi:hypothetical protein B0H16DRAFT_1682052 [Mycena metata]|uniref:Uncharacterized protein n=1 Tax=Mycena metata TaxID=1033252 RepID=A0AAD7KHH4_9AGAR|nr:hypothetical protein B0H16DRAFT_1682052 [Mycena metata]